MNYQRFDFIIIELSLPSYQLRMDKLRNKFLALPDLALIYTNRKVEHNKPEEKEFKDLAEILRKKYPNSFDYILVLKPTKEIDLFYLWPIMKKIQNSGIQEIINFVDGDIEINSENGYQILSLIPDLD